MLETRFEQNVLLVLAQRLRWVGMGSVVGYEKDWIDKYICHAISSCLPIETHLVPLGQMVTVLSLASG